MTWRMLRAGLPGTSRQAAIVLRKGSGRNPSGGVSRIAHSGHSSCGILRARPASAPALASGMRASGVAELWRSRSAALRLGSRARKNLPRAGPDSRFHCWGVRPAGRTSR